ncbi:MAG: TIGR04282 family arsenosugar biosynthesis glycosyltransferase [Pseudomonadota bacterium]|nr:TIGR04282 family arsenosugar biosynthesis glycosyltransferase [Pseudomonadota bacterium]
MRFADARILIFAKAPQPGLVKTRLIPALGAQGAADLQERLLRDTVERLARADLAPVELWCAPHPDFDLFAELAGDHGIARYRQEGADLGERMGHAARAALARSESVVLVGTDCPLLDGAYVARALTALKDRDAVLGPAEDGGYALLGLKRAEAELFRDIPWGGDRVAALTRERMDLLGWDRAELPILWDLDRPEDLMRFEPLHVG